jgi:GrpB-like predicted nucleotidyltransferase (UPF0157 family)
LNDLVDSSDSLDDDRVLIGGREHRPVVITAYDPAWPRRYGQEQRRIAEALGRRALRIDHIGSTSVPGLAAKPVVDVLVAVDDVHDERITSLVELVGYVLRVREPGHRMVRTPERDVHVHLWRAESDDVRRHLLFRDWLRVDPSDRALYERVKRELAARDWPDTNDYAEAKTEVIEAVTRRAETWAAKTGWAP